MALWSPPPPLPPTPSPQSQSLLPDQIACEFGYSQEEVDQEVLRLGVAMNGECIYKKVQGVVKPELQQEVLVEAVKAGCNLTHSTCVHQGLPLLTEGEKFQTGKGIIFQGKKYL